MSVAMSRSMPRKSDLGATPTAQPLELLSVSEVTFTIVPQDCREKLAVAESCRTTNCRFEVAYDFDQPLSSYGSPADTERVRSQ